MITKGQYIYYFLLFFLICLSLFFDFRKNNGRTKLILYCFLVLILSLFAGTRIGWSDQEGYVWVYDMIPPLPAFLLGNTFVQFRMEYLFVFFNSILKCFSDNPLIMFFSFAFITVSLNLYAYKKYSPYFILSVVFFYSGYYFGGTMIAIRMGIAMAIILFGLSYLADKRRIVFFITIFVACLFHISSISVLFGYLLYQLKPSKKTLFFSLLLFFILGFFAPFANWLFSYFMKFSGISVLVDNGLSYLGNEKFGYVSGVLRPTMLKQLAICLLAMRYRDFLSKQLKYFDVLFVFYCASTMWRFIFNDLALFSSRCGALLGVGEPVIIASLLLLFKPNQRVGIAVLLFLFALGSFYLNFITFDYPPYVSVLFGGTYWRDGYFGI
ncbi:MAG: EpsG family protein [Dehalococcoidales bacterium]|nr:EpsG family protein [Dehalococcoidales bacterium]